MKTTHGTPYNPSSATAEALPHVYPCSVTVLGKMWQISPVFGPIRGLDGRLVALEMLSRITEQGTGGMFSPETFFARASA